MNHPPIVGANVSHVMFLGRFLARQNVALAVLNSKDWRRVNPAPDGLPGFAGTPPVIFLPA
jgi:hypothetical protein